MIELAQKLAKIKIKRYINCVYSYRYKSRLKVLFEHFREYHKSYNVYESLRLTLDDVTNYLKRRKNQCYKGNGVRNNTGRVAIFSEGGIGDTIIGARFVRDCWKQLGISEEFDVFSNHSSIAQLVYANVRKFNVSKHIRELNNESYLCIINVGQYIVVEKNNIDNKASQGLTDLIGRIEAKYNSQKMYFQARPKLDGIFADVMVSRGLKRYDCLNNLVDVQYGGHMLKIKSERCAYSKFLENRMYITIHDGIGDYANVDALLPTKSRSRQFWEELILKLKESFPDIAIVQVGGKIGTDYNGVDLQLRNKIKISESFDIIKGALIHIDIESGLVHLATCFEVPSIVFFGPTSLRWFGYDENLNVSSMQCGNCWWSTDLWMKVCPLGYKNLVCRKFNGYHEIINKIERERRKRNLYAIK